MTTYAVDLYRAAVTLDEAPQELLNGGTAAALQALQASTPAVSTIATKHDVDPSALDQLWDRAISRLSTTPEPGEIYAIAAEAAGLLYAAAWVLEAAALTTDDVEALM